MSLTKYCEFDEVRSALGVNALELKDTVLSLPVYEMGLLRELNKVSLSLTAAFSTVSALQPGHRTGAEQALFEAARLFSVYAVARQVGVSLPTFAPKDVGDGKATVSRFSGEPFTKVLDGIDSYYQAMKVGLQEALADFGTPSASATGASAIPFRAAKRGYDPVTGTA